MPVLYVTSVGDTKLEESSINNSSNAKAGESLLASDNKKELNSPR